MAHSANDGGAGVAELLRDHLRATADRAGEFAAAFAAQEQAFAAGLLHDLGKYSDHFQRRLSDPSLFSGVDHWSAGAMFLAARYQQLGTAPALAAAGHHTGLPELDTRPDHLANAMADRLKKAANSSEVNVVKLLERFHAHGLTEGTILQGMTPSGDSAGDMLDVRMLFSALVDADFLETEAHFEGNATEPRCLRPDGPTLDVEQAIEALTEHLAQVRGDHSGEPMAETRDLLYRCCIETATESTGPFSLAAPTGAGKTLAMLALALHHARANRLRRIVLVMPFLNIIEQTAQVYRSIFSSKRGFAEHTVLEHHSLAGSPDSSTNQRGDGAFDDSARLFSQNWDAPIILTSSVQFFESLMADRSSRCRKLHRLARSVILFDEVQTLPIKLAVATLATVSRLVDPDGPYGSSVVFATATQPAFDALDGRVRDLTPSGWRPREIMANPERLYTEAAKRVRVSWRYQDAIDLEALAVEVAQHDGVLCIVNLKRHAIRLAAMLREDDAEGLCHLSTNMCPAHRVAVLTEVTERLKRSLPVRLVATQCVEAGVDLDFPVVYRALAPLESIAQAAGRCNRHGGRETGQVVVFKPFDEQGLYPPGYKAAVNATESYLNFLAGQADLDSTEILNNPSRLRQYYEHFYVLSGRSSTEPDDERKLLDAVRVVGGCLPTWRRNTG